MKQKVPVSKRALMARINRKLKHEGECLKTTRGGTRWSSDLGDYYVVSLRSNSMVRTHVHLEKFGKELGVLEEWERLTES